MSLRGSTLLNFGGADGTVPDAALTVVDQADGTGATATIAGTGSNDENDVLVYRFAGVAGGLELVGTFSRIGNGTVDLVLGVGTYFASLTADGFTAGQPVFFAVTDGAQCLWDQILDALVDKLQSLPLTDMPTANIRRGKLPINFNAQGTIGIIVSPVPETIGLKFNRSDDIGYGCLVTAFKASNQDNSANLGQELKWREQIQAHFKLTPAVGPQDLIPVAGVYNLGIEPGPVVLPEAFIGHQYDAGAVVIRVFARKPR